MTDPKKLLYGHDDEQGIVAVETVPGKEHIAHVFRRTDNGVESDYRPFKLFAYTTADEPALNDLFGEVDYVPAAGGNFYNLILQTQQYGSLKWLRYNANNVYVPPLSNQYLCSSGKTLFKGMNFDDPVRLYFDIEVITAEGFEFPNSARRQDEIVIISASDNRGNEWVLHQDEHTNEIELLQSFIALVQDVDPDILIGHNVFKFDLPYIIDRCKMHDIEFAIGRNGTEPYCFDTNIKFAERSEAFTNVSVYGRHVIDTYFLAKQYDIVKRELPSLGLKEIIKYLGLAAQDRVYVEGSQITSYWFNRREELLSYALDDVRETRIVDKMFGQSVYYATQFVPYPHQEVFRYGTGTKIEAMFLREYYRQLHSWPKADTRREYGGGYAGTFEYGHTVAPLVYVDVSSLYPSLGVLLNIHPAKDELNIYQPLLGGMKSLRLDSKALAKKYERKGNKEAAEEENAKQNALKIYINTGYYGYLGWEYGSFNDYDEAERITTAGQNVIKQINEIVTELGGQPVRTDTDGSLVKLPSQYEVSFEGEMEFIAEVEQMLNEWFVKTYGEVPERIILDHDGRYQAIITFDKKSYVLQDYDGKVKVKGNTLKGRNTEPFARQFLSECITAILSGDYSNVYSTYEKWKSVVENGLLTAEQIAKTVGLNMSLEEYKNKVSGKMCNRSAVYELAVAASRRYEKGDNISFYVRQAPMETVEVRGKTKTRPKKLRAFEAAAPIAEYSFDYDIKHYTKRLHAAARKLLSVFGKDEFPLYFYDVKLYKKDLDRLLNMEGNDDDED